MSNLYRTSIDYGGWFSFNSTRKGWNPEYAEKMLNHFFSMSLMRKMFKGYNITDELLITTNINYSSMEGKSALVIGGGPSSNLLNDEIFDSYDYVFSCNHFYKNEFLSKKKVNVILVGDEVNLQDGQFLDYINTFKPLLGFEHSSKRTTYQIASLQDSYPRIFVYLTRYFSRLGYVPRAMILAKMFGVSQIGFIGMDGFKSNKHYFENNKQPPSFNKTDLFQEQMRIFCNYMYNDLGCKKGQITNLGEDYEDNIYNGILEEYNK